jgi:hypothetical protein
MTPPSGSAFSEGVESAFTTGAEAILTGAIAPSDPNIIPDF